MVDLSVGYVLRPDIRYRVVGGEGVVVRQDEGEVLVLNDVGARMLQLLAEGLSLTNIVSRLVSEYDVDALQLQGDLADFSRELLVAGVIEPGDPAASGSARQ